MKKLLSFLSAVVLIFVLTAFQSNNSQSSREMYGTPYVGQKCYWDDTVTDCHWDNPVRPEYLCGEVIYWHGMYICFNY